MRRCFTYRCALLLSTFLLSQSLFACSGALDKPTLNEFDQKSEQEYIKQIGSNEPPTTSQEVIPTSTKPAITVVSTSIKPTNTPSSNKSSNTVPPALAVATTSPAKPVSSALPAKPIITPLPAKAPVMAYEVLGVRGTSISLNEGIDLVISKLGSPNRIIDTENDFDYYIYNNDYSRLLFVAVKDGFVVGYYTDSIDLNFKGIRSGAGIHKVEKALGTTFSMAEVLTQTNDYYTVKILMDKLVTQTVTGIYLFANSIKQEDFSDSVMRDIELIVYDLTNSVRVRNNESILSWSSSAALSARKHSLNMSMNDFFDHLDPEGRSPGDRLKAEGISYRYSGENIIGGYGSAILSNHGWFNSSCHRKNMLNSNFRYLGVGFTYDPESTYNTYITQNFYR